MDTTDQKSIVVDDKTYNVDDLTEQQQEMIQLHTRFSEDVRELRIKLAQAELAREALGTKIANSVKLSDPDLQNKEVAPAANDTEEEAPASETETPAEETSTDE